MMRINRYLAACGLGSRRAVENLIRDRRIAINGEVVTDLATRIEEDIDRVTLDGRPVGRDAGLIYVLLNKPQGYVTTASDERGRRTVLELVHLPQRIFPVGRLDYNTTGLLLLTNDGELAHRLTHPRFKVPKLYHTVLESAFDPDHFTPLTQGVTLADGITQPCKARFYSDSRCKVEIELREGRQQQVRRMFAALGYRVRHLNRVRFGPLRIERLPRGEWRYLEDEEIRALRTAAGLTKTVE